MIQAQQATLLDMPPSSPVQTTVLLVCIKCGEEAQLVSPSGTRYCKKHGYCARRTCLKSVDKFVMHPRLGIYVCPCVVKFELEMQKKG